MYLLTSRLQGHAERRITMSTNGCGVGSPSREDKESVHEKYMWR